MSDQQSNNKHQSTGGGNQRRSYQKPSIISRERLESVANVCSPSPPAKNFAGEPVPGGTCQSAALKS